MKRWLRVLVTLGTLLVAFGWMQQTKTAKAESVGYSVSTITPKNQDDKKVTYFALRVKPNEQQKLTIVIHNSSKSAKKFQVGVNQAMTNTNGVIDYSQSNPKLDSSLKVGIKDVFGKNDTQKVTVNAKSSKKVSVNYKMPAKKIDGMILGGVYVKELKDNNTGSKKNGVTISNAFAYVVGVRLRESGIDVAPDMRLNAVKAGSINGFSQVQANLQNPRPGLMKALKVVSKVTKQGSSKTVLSQTKEGMAMAPNSNFNYSIPWGDKQLTAGDYTLKLDAYAKGGYHWQFTKNFTITQKDISSLKNRINTPQKSYLWWFVGGGILIVLLLAIIVYLLMKNRKKDDDTDETE
ncbi:DUF916 and DUF3324 domain-containing protein [Levilactobacillus fuyuanensis]|uniref:DUF916 and DUF3324 domain-containing protein n=1 Tax=Levilactobacillus fuyuanensis TaxID=2486022 RepID=A0ABW4H4G7_9LACO|nr:DUF916 and DUF3324 domain-containing protein [Levilactobacillus fuyuanensis]